MRIRRSWQQKERLILMRGWGKHRLVSRPLSRQHQETKEHGKAGTAIHIPGCNLSAVIRNGERYAVFGSAPVDTALNSVMYVHPLRDVRIQIDTPQRMVVPKTSLYCGKWQLTGVIDRR